MAKINLLPWREERRKQRNQEYYGVIAAVLLSAAALVYALNEYYVDALSAQNQRNQFITQEMNVLDAKIEQIRNLRETRQQLIERMELIQALQGNRPIIVRIFDEMARAIPDDLYYSSIDIKNTQINVKGIAKSNNRVSALMRNFDQSDWFSDPVLIRVQARSEGVNEFEVTMTRVQPKADGEER